jgi:hypothetical protein
MLETTFNLKHVFNSFGVMINMINLINQVISCHFQYLISQSWLPLGLTLAPARALFRRGSRTTVWWLFCEVVTAIVCHGWSWSEESCLSRF